MRASESAPAAVLSLTAIVPATNRPATLDECLEAIADAMKGPEEVIVVDDPSLRHPALARNAGARRAVGDILVFVDADVTVHPDAFVRIRKAFEADEHLVGLFGSYDDAPAANGIVSSFRNLLHYHVHQNGAGPASTFWAGLGCIRRDAFEACGGFSEHPIEDIELGMRLADAGARVVLDPAVQGKHLKKWNLWSMMRTDLLVRGVPWVGLLLEHRGTAKLSALNLGWRHRLSAIACVALVAAAALRNPWAALAAGATLVGLNLSFYRLLTKRGGFPRAVGGVAVHFVHHLIAVAAVPLGMLLYLTRRRQPRAHSATH